MQLDKPPAKVPIISNAEVTENVLLWIKHAMGTLIALMDQTKPQTIAVSVNWNFIFVASQNIVEKISSTNLFLYISVHKM